MTTISLSVPPRLVVVGKIRLPYPLREHSQLHSFYQRVARRCARIDLISLSSLPQGHHEVDGPIQVHAGPNRPGLAGHAAFLAHSLACLRRLAREPRTGPLVCWLSDPLDSLPAGLLAKYGYGLPLVVQLQGDMYSFNSRQYGPLKPKVVAALTTAAARSADRVRVLTTDLAAQLAQQGIARSKILVITPRVDLDLFDPTRWAAQRSAWRAERGWGDGRVLLFAGQLSYTKGADLLVRAMLAVREQAPVLRLSLAGRGPLLDVLRAEVQAAGLEDRVRFEGWVPYDELPAAYAGSDLAVIPSRDEGFGRGALQAAAMGKPSLVTAITGNRAAVRHGLTGWYTEPNLPALARELCSLAQLPAAELEAMGRRARAVMTRRFDLDNNVRDIVRGMVTEPVASARPPVLSKVR